MEDKPTLWIFALFFICISISGVLCSDTMYTLIGIIGSCILIAWDNLQ